MLSLAHEFKPNGCKRWRSKKLFWFRCCKSLQIWFKTQTWKTREIYLRSINSEEAKGTLDFRGNRSGLRLYWKMFFTVRYGDDEYQLFNSHCRNKVLLENMRKRCNCSPNDVIDLADEQAHVKNLSDQPHFKFASLTLQPRATYILVKVDERARDGQRIYTPLLDGLESSNPEFLTRLANRKVNPDSGPKDGGHTKDGSHAPTGTRGPIRTGKRRKGH